MAGGDTTEEARSQAERFQADRVWDQKPRSPGAHKFSSAEWLQRKYAGDRARVFRLTGSWKAENFMPLQMHKKTGMRLPYNIH